MCGRLHGVFRYGVCCDNRPTNGVGVEWSALTAGSNQFSIFSPGFRV